MFLITWFLKNIKLLILVFSVTYLINELTKNQ
jgi:hypothetical protein